MYYKVKQAKTKILKFFLHSSLKDSVTRKVNKLQLQGGRVGTKDVSDPNFIVLRCPFNLLRIFKDGAHQSKTEFMLGPGSGVKLTSDTDIPRPPPCDCSASRSGGWREFELTNNRFSRLEADLLASKGLSEVESFDHGVRLLK